MYSSWGASRSNAWRRKSEVTDPEARVALGKACLTWRLESRIIEEVSSRILVQGLNLQQAQAVEGSQEGKRRITSIGKGPPVGVWD
jgi:hypothetical protein